METYNQNLCYIQDADGNTRCGPCDELTEGESIIGQAPDGTPVGPVDKSGKLPKLPQGTE